MAHRCVRFLLLVLLGVSAGVPVVAAPADASPTNCARLYDQAREGVNWKLGQAWMQGRGLPADALRRRARLLDRARSCYGNQRLDKVGYTYWYEAAVYGKLQRFSKAFGAFDAFFERFQPVPDSLAPSTRTSLTDQVTEMYWARGYLHYRLGNLTGAVGDYLSAFRSIPASDRERRATLIMEVGVIYQRLQDFEAAERYFRQAERLLGRAEAGDADLRTLRARALFRRADLILEREFAGRPDSAAVREALSLVQAGRPFVSDADSDLYGKQLLLMTDASLSVGRTDAARAYNRRALRWARRNGDAHTRMLALFKRGWIEQRSQNWAASQPYLRRALSIARQRRDLDNQRRILGKIGRAHEVQENWKDSEAAYRKAVAVVEAYRSSLRTTQWSLTAFSQWQDVYRGLIRVLLAQGQFEEAFHALEKTRARHLTDLRVQSRVSEQLPPRQRVRYDSLTRVLTSVRAQLAEGSGAEDDSLRNLESRLVAERRQLVVLDDPTRRLSSIDSLQRALRREERAIVSYFLDDSFTVPGRSHRSHAFVLTADTLHAIPLPGATRRSVQATIAAVSPLFASARAETPINAMHFDLRALHTLYRDLYGPIVDALPPDRPLTILPDGPLYRIPFSMLVTEEPPNRFAYERASYLLHRRATSFELSASLLPDAGASSRRRRPDDLLGMGVSRFRTRRAPPRSIRSMLPETDSDSSRLRLPSLPGVEREIRSLRRITGSGRFRLNEGATESIFHAEKHTAKVIHLASHSFVHPTSPLYNTFLLAVGDSSASTDDGWLFLHEIQTEDSGQIPLVVLSGCSTAKGTLRSGEGMEGLQYAFRAMGARSTVSNLWPADDDATVDLTRSFYQFLQEGHPKDVALQQAQAQYLATHPDRASPFFWAPTVLYGSAKPIPLEQPSLPIRLVRALDPTAWLLAGLVAAVLGGAVLFLRSDVRIP